MSPVPSEGSVGEFFLLLKPQTGSVGGYLLEAYDTFPTGSGKPLASAALPSLNYGHLNELTGKILEKDPLTPQQMGDYLATWLFVERPGATALPFAHASDLPYNPVGSYLRRRLESIPQKQRLGLWICLDPEILRSLEFRLGRFLPLESLERNSLLPVRIVRGVANGFAPSEPLEVAGRLRVLLVYANPDKEKAPPNLPYPHMEGLRRHFEELCKTLDPLVHAGELFLEVLRNPTPEQARDTLTRFNPHVLVFAGHGYGWENGGLVCIREGTPAPWPFPELVKATREIPEPALRLAVFIACRSFVAAPGLLAAGVPAVVAMQPLWDAYFPAPSMPIFAKPFFGTLAHLGPIADAHAAARRALEASGLPAVALMPTLWLATAQDRLFASPEERLRAIYLDTLLGKPEVALLPFPGVEGGVTAWGSCTWTRRW